MSEEDIREGPRVRSLPSTPARNLKAESADREGDASWMELCPLICQRAQMDRHQSR